ncbi:uncharacterized protein CXQ87_004732 [Candidozyma duobushaemuli]|uniref:Uncharacterized protein n=2 Tax=Candidozyma TaxID=3303203 RepID=A0ABX8IF36_9ASCO|nr:uncharacterized protein CXQ87_004732 [[Candida] duobushaemulonis]PVH16441.1 hypothetical protein CXQ87_004732 [[Candida] duobushaemulonis]QWU90208.1 hypothetical protein CA3LBN_004569 [[Candida] haemuloni]
MKNLVLVIHCTSQPGEAIRYNYTDDTDFYIIYNFDLLSRYIRKLLGDYKNTIVVLIYKQLPALLEASKLLYECSEAERAKQRLEDYKMHYKRHLAQATANRTNGVVNTDFEVRLPQGQADRIFGFETIYVFDATEVQDHLSEANTGVQQLLRYLALKHGAYYGALSGKLEEFEDPSTCQLLVSSLKGGLKEGEQHIFSPNGEQVSDNIDLHQQLALGWDSWTKVQMIARSIAKREGWDLIDEEVKMDEFEDLYEAYIEGNPDEFVSKAKKLVGFEEEPPKPERPPPLTYDDAIKQLEAVLKK